MVTEPKLSIGIPVFNGERFMAQLLDSLLEQTFQDFEIIISDNASTDRTQQVCREFARRDGRIHYFRNTANLGANPNFNLVFSRARAKYFKWAAYDDLYEPEYLEKCVDVLDDNPDVVLAHSDHLCVDEACRPLEPAGPPNCYLDPCSSYVHRLDDFGLGENPKPVHRLREIFFRMNSNLQIFGVIRREALERTHLFQNFYGADKLLLVELALIGRFKQIPGRLFIKRFQKDMSWTLTPREQKAWSRSGDAMYSRRLRQLVAFVPVPFRQDLPLTTTVACLAMIALLGPKVLFETLTRRQARRRIAIAKWR